MPTTHEGQRVLNFGLSLALAAGSLSVHAMSEENPTISTPEGPPAAIAGPVVPLATQSPEPRPTPTRASRSQHSRGTNLGQFEATCYNLHTRTATGVKAGYGKVAVDPDVIKMGTRLYISGYGEAVAADTGGAIDGRIIDVWKPTRAQCLKWGRRTVQVTQLSPR